VAALWTALREAAAACRAAMEDGVAPELHMIKLDLGRR
jgi:hypothetical protein